MQKKKRPFAWSYSSLSAFETCALKHRFRMEKVPTEPNQYLVRGIAIHKLGEDYLNGVIKKVPKEYQLFSKSLRDLKSEGAKAEFELAFTREWKLTGWWDNPWLRVKIDVLSLSQDDTIKIIDFKTGRPKEYPDQERLYKVAALTARPDIKKAVVLFWYLDHGITLPKVPTVVSRKNFLTGAQKEFEVRAGRMEKEKKFAPNPGGHCSYCDYSKRKNGPCKF